MTLFETLVALAILTLIIGAVAGLRLGPSPALESERRAAARLDAAANARRRAAETGAPVVFDAPDTCGGEATILFLPDGTARGPDLCLDAGGREVRLALDPLTGRLVRAPAP